MRCAESFSKREVSRTILQLDQANSIESLSCPIPASPLITEADATLFGDRNRILELDEAALGMRQRGLDRNHHAALQRPVRVVVVVGHRAGVGEAGTVEVTFAVASIGAAANAAAFFFSS